MKAFLAEFLVPPLAVLVVLVMCGILFVSLDKSADAAATGVAGTDAIPSTVRMVAPVTMGPIAYFDMNCARCHGPQGSFHGTRFGASLGDIKLHEYVVNMSNGPGNAPMGSADLPAEIAYHRSLILKTPFIAIVKQSDKQLEGEVTPGATVTLTAAGKTSDAVVTGSTFTVKLDAAIPPDAQLHATAAGKTTILIAGEQYTHQDRLP